MSEPPKQECAWRALHTAILVMYVRQYLIDAIIYSPPPCAAISEKKESKTKNRKKSTKMRVRDFDLRDEYVQIHAYIHIYYQNNNK